jgi:hypothetical protein
MRRGIVHLAGHTGDEFGRVARVLRTLARLDEATLRKIGSAFDHKGMLSISWIFPRSETDTLAVESAWEKENEYEIEHLEPSDPF